MQVDWLITELFIHGGAETYILRMTPLLRDKGVELRIICLQKTVCRKSINIIDN